MTENKPTLRLSMEEMVKRGYVDVVGNIGINDINDLRYEINTERAVRNPSEMVVILDEKTRKATIYIPKEDFEKAGKK